LTTTVERPVVDPQHGCCIKLALEYPQVGSVAALWIVHTGAGKIFSIQVVADSNGKAAAITKQAKAGQVTLLPPVKCCITYSVSLVAYKKRPNA